MKGQEITVAQALRAYTMGSAYAVFAERQRGSIAEGKLADLVVLSADYLSVPEKQIESIKPVATMIGGRFVYTDPAAGLTAR